ncbi:hypothetical protein [uncultured Parabacteroides sp.]|uniref:hypothetical protein n=1 Tax=uncultured Parabacteroides sp. TaxID=512312 RepID=UPI00258E264C|nr:hypothetical protein [uncultured Parabacteroides sp.]
MKSLTFTVLLFLSYPTSSANKDSLELLNIQEKFIDIEKKINSIHSENQQQAKYTQDLIQISDSLKKVSVITQKEIKIKKRQIQNLVGISDSLKNISITTQEEIKMVEDRINSDIDETRLIMKSNNDLLFEEIQSKTIYGGIGFAFALSIVGFVYLILHKRIYTDSLALHKIKQVQDSIQEESVKLDNKLIELLDKQLNVQALQTTSLGREQDHSLALKVADEIVRIEMNLSRMDTSMKGHKQLCKAVERIKNNFLANGYEMVDMLGKSYNEGMKVVANFVSDENLKSGEQIITGIIKPQINYHGQMIQAAQITVSQNI